MSLQLTLAVFGVLCCLGQSGSYLIPVVEETLMNRGPHDFEEIPFQQYVPEVNVGGSKMRSLDSRFISGPQPLTQFIQPQPIIQIPIPQPIAVPSWPLPPQQPVLLQPIQTPLWQSGGAQGQAAQAWQMSSTQPSQSWQPANQPQGTPAPTPSWQPQQSQFSQQPTVLPVQPSPPPTSSQGSPTQPALTQQPWQQTQVQQAQPQAMANQNLAPPQPSTTLLMQQQTRSQPSQQSSNGFAQSQTNTPLSPSKDPRFQKYFPTENARSNVSDDVFGRSTKAPSSIPRFSRYFVAQSQASTQTVVSGQASVPTAVPQINLPNMQQPVTTQSPPTISSTPKPSLSNLQNFLTNSFPLSIIDTESKKCDATANFVVGSRPYLVAFQNPTCQNMTWSDASNFCQSRGLALFSPTLTENAEAVNKIGSLLKQGAGFWTDGVVTGQNLKSPLVVWTVAAVNPVPVTPGKGLFSNTGDDGRPQPDNFLFRTTGKAGNEESCIGLFNNKNKDGIKLHDFVCSAQLGVVCHATPSNFS